MLWGNEQLVKSDFEIRFGMRPFSWKTLRVTPERMDWGGRVIVLHGVEHVALLEFNQEISSTEWTTSDVWTQYRFWFADDQGEVSMAWGASRNTPRTRQRRADAAGVVHQVIAEVIAPRLAAEKLSRIQRGEDVVIGGRQVIKLGGDRGRGNRTWFARRRLHRAASTVVLNQQGIELRGKEGSEAVWRWTDIADVTMYRDAVYLLVRDEPVQLLTTNYCDAVVLPGLIRAMLP